MKVLLKSAYLITGLLLLGAAHSAMAGVAVVVNPKNSVSSMSKDQVAKIFLGKTNYFPTGTKATPIDLGSGDKSREKFYTDAMGKTQAHVNAYWAKKIFTGQGQPPRSVYEDSEVINTVNADPTAIGYINDSSVNAKVKVVLTLP